MHFKCELMFFQLFSVISAIITTANIIVLWYAVVAGSKGNFKLFSA